MDYLYIVLLDLKPLLIYDSMGLNGKSLSWMGLTRERWCCTRDLVSRLDMNTCQTSIKTDILL